MKTTMDKQTIPKFLNPRWILAAIILGAIAAWLSRETATALLFDGKSFVGRSLMTQFRLLAVYTSIFSLTLFGVWWFWVSRDPRPAERLDVIIDAALKPFGAINFQRSLRAGLEFLREHRELTIILLLGFGLRMAFAGQDSYWLDEFYSVEIYGYANSSGLEVIQNLSRTSIHLPLYQVILFYWMELFGTGETATRSLSVLYVTLAMLCLYLFTLRILGRRMAVASTLLFSVCYMTVYYSMESRPYAQTLLLCTLSSALFIGYLDSLEEAASWQSYFLRPEFLYLCLANLLVSFTHYYNFFFLCAQGVFLLVYVCSRSQPEHWPQAAFRALAVCAAPVMLFAILWGPVSFKAYHSQIDDYSAITPDRNPWSILDEYVLGPNLEFSSTVHWIVLFLAVAATIRFTTRKSHAADDTARGTTPYLWYVACWAILPSLFAYLGFFIGQFERYSMRYFIFMTPPLMILVNLAANEAVTLLRDLIRWTAKRTGPPPPLGSAAGYSLMLALVLVAPGGYRGLAEPKDDYRGIAREIAHLAQRNPDKRYVIYETSFRKAAFLDHYLEHFSPGMAVFGTLQESEDGIFLGESVASVDLVRNQNRISTYDYLIVAFPHLRTVRFPNALNYLSSEYDLVDESLDESGHGFIVYRIP